jgi:hypothetical protein
MPGGLQMLPLIVGANSDNDPDIEIVTDVEIIDDVDSKIDEIPNS